MKRDEREFCPHFQKAIELIGKRWTGSILRALMPGPLRFSQIAAAVPEISDRSLSSRLKELEREGVVIRHVASSQPVSVSYELTDKGLALEETVSAVEHWAHDWVAPHEHPADAGRL